MVYDMQRELSHSSGNSEKTLTQHNQLWPKTKKHRRRLPPRHPQSFVIQNPLLPRKASRHLRLLRQLTKDGRNDAQLVGRSLIEIRPNITSYIMNIHHPSRESATYVETEKFKIFRDPRISASKLGEFLVSDESRKLTILKNSKKAPKAITIRYAKAREAFAQSFQPDGFSAQSLIHSATKIIANLTSKGTWQDEDNKLSADVLEKLAVLVEQIEIEGATKIARPKEGWGNLSINGVNVSLNLDCAFSYQYRGRKRTGAVVLYTTKDDKMSLNKSLGDNTAGDYVAAMVFQFLESKMAQFGSPLPQKCFIVDVHREIIHQPSTRTKTLFKHIEAGCEGIASRWKDIKI